MPEQVLGTLYATLGSPSLSGLGAWFSRPYVPLHACPRAVGLGSHRYQPPFDGLSISRHRGNVKHFFQKSFLFFLQKGVDKRRPFCYNIIRSREEPKGHWDPRRTCLSLSCSYNLRRRAKVKVSQSQDQPAGKLLTKL